MLHRAATIKALILSHIFSCKVYLGTFYQNSFYRNLNDHDMLFINSFSSSGNFCTVQSLYNVMFLVHRNGSCNNPL